MAESNSAPSVSSAFATTPVNPNVIPQSNPEPAPAAESTTPSGADLNAVLSSLSDDNAQFSLSPTPAPQDQPPAETQPEPAPRYQLQTPQFPPEVQLAMQQGAVQAQQLSQHNSELEEKLRQQDEVINNLMQQQEEYNKLKNQTQANNLEFGDLATVDADDAKRISAAVLQAVQAQLAPIQDALQKTQQYAQQSNQIYAQQQVQRDMKNTLDRVLAKHPDFIALQRDPAYLQFIRQRDGLSSQTYDDRSAYEFQNGNAEYVIDLINKFKQQTPQANSLAAVAPVQTATTPVAPAGPVTKLPTLSELNQWMQMRQITPDQYNQILAKIRAAQKQG